MRTSARIALGLGATAILAASMALPASAADTTTTVAIQPGVLSLAAPASFDLGNVVPGQTTQATISGVSVSDGRAGVLGWAATVAIGNFTGTNNAAHVIPAANVTYTPAAATVTGTSSVVKSGAVTAPASATVQTASGVNGNNTAQWSATVAVAAPSDALADSYTATIVHSVS
jgi:hypothetical protein